MSTCFIQRSSFSGGDDLKQLAEAQNDDFQEIITLVGMISKPLHVKRFQKALADYRHETTVNRSLVNGSCLAVPIRRISTDEILSDRTFHSSLIHSKSTNHHSLKTANTNTFAWRSHVHNIHDFHSTTNNAILLRSRKWIFSEISIIIH
jgi:hypothetical protein